ncbi:MAG: hypothetical protein ACE5GE_05825 [Phycisphaerae bacterium]
MTAQPDASIAQRFRRQMRLASLLQGCLIVALCVTLVVFYRGGRAWQIWTVLGLGAMAGLWIAMSWRTIKQVRSARSSSTLLAQGQLEEARRKLLQVLEGPSPLRSGKILACHYLAVSAHLDSAYREAAIICRSLLRYRLGSMNSIATATRMVLADSLLMLNDTAGAGPVVQAIQQSPLSLSDRMTMLPIELRYQLAAGRSEQAVEDLTGKVKIAELLEAPGSALTHVLLAEACRRMDMPQQQEYFLRRARLLADVEPIVRKYHDLLNQVTPATSAPPPSPSPDSQA